MKVLTLISVPRKKKGQINIQPIWIEIPDEVWEELLKRYA